jgi:CheY-like chemotaxis protein
MAGFHSLLVELLPTSKEPPMANILPETKLKSPIRPHEKGVRVLVVNDYADNVESMAMLLRLHGHEVETALGGHAALRAARENPPEVVLLDISMPGMNGYEVARQLRSMFENRIVLIALTANGFEEDRRCCMEAGFNRHLVKPTDPVKLEQLLRELAETL